MATQCDQLSWSMFISVTMTQLSMKYVKPETAYFEDMCSPYLSLYLSSFAVLSAVRWQFVGVKRLHALLRIVCPAGYWLFHCHFLYHVPSGMSVVLHVGDREDLPHVPRGFPRCGNFLPPIQPATTNWSVTTCVAWPSLVVYDDAAELRHSNNPLIGSKIISWRHSAS
jgi:hypothetical protein